ncbi:thioredoxin domain-containing protein [Nocardioides sp. zg-579]|uniref:Thioredoxin domain-containing protein n=1 Tax=Nocardioides marmotae TaxID=2663857 RepID=A0A6I3JG93_9ACTN|nr:DsbA family oxidoreductase [Nocardioides marmotae]MCR6033493.1 thioredoxin domain-containing protein [Gordonia jinghuaiqii]MTB97151.1 thioredoxin domain-containing protein [Nocardioides marmotae]QKE00800.1 DsbA family oxidoreductase [Nocardioides marmotae]
MRIEIWSDVVCPWCYVGKRRLEKALAGFEHRDAVEVVYRSFELDPSAPRHGHESTLSQLAKKYGQSEDQMRAGMQSLIDTAADEGLDMRLFDNVHTNTVDAHRLLHLALEAGGPALQRELKEQLLAAYFLRAEDVGDHDVLRAAARTAGLAEAAGEQRVDAVLAGQEYADAVAADIAQARAYGATGVPFFVVDQRYGVSGAQPTEVFEQVLATAWADAHPVLQPVGGDADACGPDGCPI